MRNKQAKGQMSNSPANPLLTHLMATEFRCWSLASNQFKSLT
jgi:hypothetical protein